MTRDSELIGLLEDYLDDVEGHTYLPDTTRDAIRARLPLTSQRPAWWPGWRFPEMNTMMKYGLGTAAAVLVAVIAGIAALGGLNNIGAPSTTPVPSPSHTDASLSKLHAGLRQAGTYRANPFIPVEVLVTMPEGWRGGGDWLVVGPKGAEGPDGMNIRFGSVSNVFANPFDSGDGFVDPPVGPSVDDLVEAMTSHPDWTVSTPTTTTIDGYAGKIVRMTLPPDLDMPTGRFMLFQDATFGDRWAFEPGQIIDFYIIDVEGERLVLELFSYPETPAADLAERAAMLESMQLDSDS
jgi:hypothetical protein